MAELLLKNITMKFGGLLAVDNLDLDVPSGKILSLIGPNGAGKTTVFNLITGVYKPTEGTITYNGETLNGLRSNKVVSRGIARTFQNIRLFNSMTVLENVQVGLHCRTKSGAIRALLNTPYLVREEKDIEDKAMAVLEFLGLEEFRNDYASNLAYGNQRRLEIARALATEPIVLLLDEPAAGMNPQETQELDELITKIRDEGLAILLIEHDMNLVMSLSEKIFVMDYGKLIARGTPEEIKNDPVVIKAYLGEDMDA